MDDHSLSDLLYDQHWIEEGDVRLGVTVTACERCGEIFTLSASVVRGDREVPVTLACGGASFGSCTQRLSGKDLDDLIKALQRAQEEHVLPGCRRVPPEPAGAS